MTKELVNVKPIALIGCDQPHQPTTYSSSSSCGGDGGGGVRSLNTALAEWGFYGPGRRGRSLWTGRHRLRRRQRQRCNQRGG